MAPVKGGRRPQDIFTPAGRRRLAMLMRSRPLLAFDFDGTLAPIVTEPTAAVLAPATFAQLTALAAQVPLAIISGRGVRDLQSRCPVPGARFIGNHGMEGAATPAELARCRRLPPQWARQLTAPLANPLLAGVLVERKSYSLTLHYRAVAHAATVRQHLHTVAAALRPAPRLVGGKYVWNLLPVGAPDKGRALVRLLRTTRRAHALFVGDDVTDEDVFTLRDPRICTVRVGTAANTAATWSLARQSRIGTLLQILLDACG